MRIDNRNKLSAITASLAYSTLTFTTLTFSTLAFAMDDDHAIITDWQSSLAAEFVKLDTSGNGLLLPLEAAKNKAFNKKTFAKADADNDGTIDQDEYIQYRISMGAKDVPAATAMSNEASGSSNLANENTGDSTVSATTVVDNAAPTSKTADKSQDNAKPAKNTLGDTIDDSVITTKAKAAIFNTPDLKTLQISVETRHGEVLLSGFVDSETAKMKAEEVVKNVGGVKSVTNSLEVKS